MKYILLALSCTFLVTACGSDNPFKRGAKSAKTRLNGGVDKPSLVLSKEYFDTNLVSAFAKSCEDCHDNPAVSFEAALKFVVPNFPDKSTLYLRATGNSHRAIWRVDSKEATALFAWIKPAESIQLALPKSPAVLAPDAIDNVTLDKTFFENNLLSSFQKSCDRCHDNPAATFEMATELVVPNSIEKSLLYLRATGNPSDGTKHRAVWKVDSPEAAVLALWINGAKAP